MFLITEFFINLLCGKDIMEKEGLVRRLADEKFNGESPTWREARFDQVRVLCAEDDENWYMLYTSAPLIIVQEKAMKNPPTCYECGGPVDYVARRLSVHFKEFTDMGVPAGGGEVRTKRIPYCPNCNTKPSGHEVISESVEESLRR